MRGNSDLTGAKKFTSRYLLLNSKKNHNVHYIAWLNAALFICLKRTLTSVYYMSLQQNIGIALRALRAQKGVSQERLALETGIGRRYMSDIENGRRNVSLEIVEKIAAYFEMSASELVRRIEQADYPSLTLDGLKNILCERGHDDAVVLESPDYLGAIIGVSDDGRVIYDYEKMAKCLMETDGMDYEEAMEFIDYNTIRALPYMGKKRPIILNELM